VSRSSGEFNEVLSMSAACDVHVYVRVCVCTCVQSLHATVDSLIMHPPASHGRPPSGRGHALIAPVDELFQFEQRAHRALQKMIRESHVRHDGQDGGMDGG
jgi:hypothetical protein